jgi:hypothetical protein
VGPRAGLDDVEKILGFTGTRTQTPGLYNSRKMVDFTVYGLFNDAVGMWVMSVK